MRPLPRYCSPSGTPNSRSRHAPLARITAEKRHLKSCGRSKSRPRLVEGMKYTFDFFMRASIRPYSCLRCSTCQRGRPSSILPYGRVFCSITATRIPLSARISAATEPEIAPPITATKCCPGFVIDLPPRALEWDCTTLSCKVSPTTEGSEGLSMSYGILLSIASQSLLNRDNPTLAYPTDPQLAVDAYHLARQ